MTASARAEGRRHPGHADHRPSIAATAPDASRRRTRPAALSGGHRRDRRLRDRPQGRRAPAGEPCSRSTAGGRDNTIVGYRASNSIDVKVRKLDTAAGAATDHQHGRRRHPDRLGGLLDRGRLAARRGCARHAPSTTPRTGQSSTRSCPGWSSARSCRSPEADGAAPPTPMPSTEARARWPRLPWPGQQTVGFSVTVVYELLKSMLQPALDWLSAGAISTGCR